MNDKETLRRVGIGSKELAELYGFKNVASFYHSVNRKKLTAASAEIVRKVAQHLLNQK